MKKFFYHIIFLSALLPFYCKAGVNPVLGQAQADFKKVNAAYAKLENYSIDTYYTVYSEHRTEDRLESKGGKYIEYMGNSYSLIDDIQVYTINDKIISINKSDKLISVGDNVKETEDPTGFNADSLLTLCSDIKVELVNPNEKKYSLFFSGSDIQEYEKIDITINTKDNRYTKMVLYYSMSINLKSDYYAEDKKPRLEIQYKNFKLLNADPQIFNESLYIVDDNEKLKPTSKYYNYRVVDLRNKTRIKKNK